MRYDRDKLLGYLSALEAGEAGAEAAYGAFLDQLPAQFGSPKLAHEADLILAMLAAAELARAAAVSAEGPVRFEALPDDGSGGQARFRPVAFAPVGGVDAEWRGVPLQVLASVLDRSRAPQSADDEEYAAGFVYVLFRLKAALGVWRGDGAPSARYRLWLKDLAPVIARHPRLGPKVIDCHRRIVEALSAEAEALNAAFERKERVEMSAIFQVFGPFADLHISLAAEELHAREGLNQCLWHCSLLAFERAELRWSASARGCLVRWSGGQVGAATSAPQLDTVAGAYMNRGNASQGASGHGPIAAIGDYDRAIEIQADLRQALEPTGDWAPSLRGTFANAYMNRGLAAQGASGHGLAAAIGDYDRAIEVLGDLRRALQATEDWAPHFRESLASAYINRGNARQNAASYGPAAAIRDYDRAIEIQEDLRRKLQPTGDWAPTLSDTLAGAYMNRGNAKKVAAGHGPAAAIGDYDQAIKTQEDLRRTLEPTGDWHPPLRNSLANSYMNRGNAKQIAAGHGPTAAIVDFDRAIEIEEDLRRSLGPTEDWASAFRESLANAYMNRGNARQNATGHGPAAAIGDFDQAIEIREDLRRSLEPTEDWDPPLRESLSNAYMNRGNARHDAAGHGPAAAIGDYDRAIEIQEDLRRTLEPTGDWAPHLRESLASAYMNRGNAKQGAAGQGPVAAICDYDHAIEIREDLRRTLEPTDWNPPLCETLANAYMNRGIAKHEAAGHGPAAVFRDFDRAIDIQEDLRRALEPTGDWAPPLRETLANAYMNRGVAKQDAAGHGPAAAISDHDRAVEIREDLRWTLEPTGDWAPPLRQTLAMALFNRSLSREALSEIPAALEDALQAREIAGVVIDVVGAQLVPPMWIRIRDAAESQIQDLRTAL